VPAHKSLFAIVVFGVLSAFGLSGQVIAQNPIHLSWGTPSNSPQNQWPAQWAAGNEADGTPIFVCRANYNGGMHPGKVVAGNCNIGYGGNEIVLQHYVVLMGPLTMRSLWVEGFSPANRNFRAGVDSDGVTPLYVCRALYNGGLHPGKVVAGNCNITYGGREVVLHNFQVLQAVPVR